MRSLPILYVLLVLLFTTVSPALAQQSEFARGVLIVSGMT